ncbi:MAG: hypothetical protein OSJ44_14715 [Lachnospiraceae bacterium]|nr:hypothetical protein [Lachnospiraceae bacterium]
MKFPYRAANSGEKDFFFPGLPLFGLLQLFSFGMDKLELNKIAARWPTKVVA